MDQDTVDIQCFIATSGQTSFTIGAGNLEGLTADPLLSVTYDQIKYQIS